MREEKKKKVLPVFEETLSPNEKIFFCHLQRRIANISVGASTVRGQPKGTANIAREYLSSVNLQDFSNFTTEDEFKILLDEHTQILKKKLPSKSWGMSRKVLNIFLFQATHDILLNRQYFLDKVIPYLELPLDNPNAKRLKKFAKPEDIKLEWRNISSLESDDSVKFQQYARKHASQNYQRPRCYLDVFWWRSENCI